ncbi:aspartate aminotransferase family protein [Candidatus Neptunochlamydia vexilliferae]|uniref:Glutamate-1-semialdehyde 2,1-aminomutase n=1 Tax=Candidatus Neptunichlamydia vexilliferae TaxID=1651774 RepID=A0ABS0B1J5_9BACT|nr:aminotransferase class III-fold pyridoxal phosphate-dependent enzyme [Candidatus Neptunochlamydia vexilliferae]MBF5060060.1 Glutamate-1-semialdehyde 2,1-aminomutase [Candidatus Neptunochlamydia vexilliferae]
MPSETCLSAKEIFEKSQEVIPGGVNSPVRACCGLGITPPIIARGEGDTITDVEGNTFIDYCMSWGALLHGHAHPEIVSRAQAQVARGSTFGIPTAIEEKLARKMVEEVAGLEQVRFVSSGTEATMSAIRLARGHTGRSLFIKFEGNYHGHADMGETITLPYNDVEAFRSAMSDEVAGVIVEPIAGNMGVVPGAQEFLEVLREETKRVGAVLIFDEVISGFRSQFGASQEVADLSCFGKIVGGGFPAAAFGGKREIMQKLAPVGKVFQAGTLSGNPVAMEAGLAALELASLPGFYEELKRKGEIITKPVREAMRGGCLQEAVGMFTLFFGPEKVERFEKLDHERFGEYFRFMWERGIYVSPSPYEASFISMAHTDAHLEKTRDTMLEFLCG